MNYWIHRCAYEGGHEILNKEHRLTIGYSDCANHSKMVEVIQKKDDANFDAVYETVYGGGVWRGRWSLWYFTREMADGDVVVVPTSGGFEVCKLKGMPMVSARKNDADIGWEWNVDIIASCYSREEYASAALLSRMKCRQTTLNIGDLKNDVNEAICRFKDKNPFSLSKELSEKCHEILDKSGSPDQFEKIVLGYFGRLGASATIQPKNCADKVGDCDESAIFPALRTTISVQVKKHAGVTDGWAVRQISEYAQSKKESREENWSYINWVVSLAEEFSDDAKRLAKDNNVVLINGQELCRMLVAKGIGDFS